MPAGEDLNDVLRAMHRDECETAAMCERTGLSVDAVYQRLSRMGLRKTKGRGAQVRGRAPAPTRARRKPTGVACEVSGCGRPSRCDGLCNMHYQRRRKGDPNWKRPIAFKRKGTVKFGGIVLERQTYDYIVGLANRRGVKVPRQASECLDWFVKSVKREEENDA